MVYSEEVRREKRGSRAELAVLAVVEFMVVAKFGTDGSGKELLDWANHTYTTHFLACFTASS
jgi:hypothetical protein